MSGDELDQFMRGLRRPAEVGDERAARVMGAVMARLPERRKPGILSALAAAWPVGLVPSVRFALPMAAAALLGIVVGQGLRPSDESVALTRAFNATYGSTYGGLGY